MPSGGSTAVPSAPRSVTVVRPELWRRCSGEAVGTAFLVAIVVGSGIAAQRLSPGDVGLQLLQNAVATAGGLIALILAIGPVSGAHFNPIVSIADRVFGGLTTGEMLGYVAAQVIGGCAGSVVANVMFSEPALAASETTRGGTGVWTGEVVATIGLLIVIFGVVRSGRGAAAPFAVGAYLASAYFFTSSTSFANPAVTMARTLTDTFAGISPSSAPAFVACQLGGLVLGVGIVVALYPDARAAATSVVVPIQSEEKLDDVAAG